MLDLSKTEYVHVTMITYEYWQESLRLRPHGYKQMAKGTAV
jgi:hypothetical protein